MVLFLKKEGEKVLTKESIDDIVSRLNDFDIKYVQKELPKLKVKVVKPKVEKPKHKSVNCCFTD